MHLPSCWSRKDFLIIWPYHSSIDFTHYYLAISSFVFKLTKGNGTDTAQMIARVREMIKEALESDGVEDFFSLAMRTKANNACLMKTTWRKLIK